MQQLQRGELGMTVHQRVKIFLALPADPHAWQATAHCGDKVSLAYWREVPIRYFNGSTCLRPSRACWRPDRQPT